MSISDDAPPPVLFQATDATKAVEAGGGGQDKNLERRRQDADALLQELGLPQPGRLKTWA